MKSALLLFYFPKVHHIEEMNFANDPRNCERDKVPTVYLDDNTKVELPTTWGVCLVCNGEGKHVNPSIDCGGLTRDDFNEDPDFLDDYLEGYYDVTCNKCGGRTTVRVVDWDAMTPELREAYESKLEAEAELRAEHLAELRMGA